MSSKSPANRFTIGEEDDEDGHAERPDQYQSFPAPVHESPSATAASAGGQSAKAANKIASKLESFRKK
jgi:hypothetical protein